MFNFSRRELLKSASISTIAWLTTAISTMSEERASLSKRSVINLNFLSEFNYAFINHFLVGDGSVGPFGASYATTTKTWMQIIDPNGWPKDDAANGTPFGGSVRVPDSANYDGEYVITWDGEGTVSIGGGQWTETNNLGTTYSRLANGHWKNITGRTAYITATVKTEKGPQLYGIQFSSTGGSRGFLKNFRFYRQADEADLLARKIFRKGFLQPLVDLNPSAIRCMNWQGGNNAKNCRFENRTLPSAGGYGNPNNWVASPAYGQTTGVNRWSLAAVNSGVRKTPATMLHGELATFRFGEGMARSGQKPISGITKATPGVVMCRGHGFNSGDQVIHEIASGMIQLDLLPVTVTVIDSDHYAIGIDTTSFSTFSTGTVNQFITIDVGARGAFPIIFPDGSTPASNYGDAYIAAGDYKTIYFDKTIFAQKDSSGHSVMGVWIFNDLGATNAHAGDVPLEICAALGNELNALSLSQGIARPIDIWINIPVWGLSSMDPDYTAESDWAKNAIDVLTNALSSVRARGYSALGYAGDTQINHAGLIVEYSNETWNFGGSGFSQTPYLCKRGLARWPGSGRFDTADMAALRSTCMVRDVKKSLAGKTKIKFLIGMQGAAGIASGSGNYSRAFGSENPGSGGNFYYIDPLVTNGAWGTPISNHDGCCIASYFDAPDTYYAASGARSFVDDSALYAGTSPYSASNKTLARANFISKVQSGKGQSIDLYARTLAPAFSSSMSSAGKIVCEYEGGADWQVQMDQLTQGGHKISAADSTFLTDCLNNHEWASAQIGYFNSVTALPAYAMPSIYTWIGFYLEPTRSSQRWAYCLPDTYAPKNGLRVEGQALLNNPTWVAMAARNRSIA